LAVEYIKADVSGRLMIDAMPSAAYEKLLTSRAMRAMLRPVSGKGVKEGGGG
ncbi:TPA: TrmB family transcriptional regulator, partial [Burkholderia vietnamiensis]|nr:TrmB family transcriptional regulator [Burkholderia vietnamiensis]